MENTLNFIIAGADVKRFHTVNTINFETVGHHSHGVAMLCHLFCEPSAALFHDLAEQYTGDIPSPAKRDLKIAKDVSDLEDEVLKNNGLMMPELSDSEARVLKLADIAHGALFCVKEIKMGNQTMRTVLNRYFEYAENMDLAYNERRVFNRIKEMVE